LLEKVDELDSIDLLKLYSEIISELKNRKILRSTNNPVADYAEWLVSKAFNWKLEHNSKAGFDAIDDKGIKYQIKARRLHSSNKSRQLSVIRNLEEKLFDVLVAILFNEDFSILEAYKIPYSLIGNYARYNDYQNGHILVLKGNILLKQNADRIDDILVGYLTKMNKNNAY
jgi:hypothetical protein